MMPLLLQVLARMLILLIKVLKQKVVAGQALDDLNKIAAAFIALQRSVQRSSFEAV